MSLRGEGRKKKLLKKMTTTNLDLKEENR